MIAPRRWARRTALSLLAGSGLTAAGLGGPFSAAALAAEATTSTTETPPQPATTTTPQASAPETASGAQSGAAQPASTTPTASAPASAPPSTTTTPAATTPAPAATPKTTEASATPAPTVVVQRKQRITRGASKPRRSGSSTGGGTQTPGAPASGAGATPNTPASVPAGAPNGVAPAPQAVGGEGGALSSLLAGSAVSAQALDFYRIPLFLLPIYKAAATQYDVPWQILAGINEVETDFGSDLSVSTAGAVGWMQFMPATWLQYGVDATAAGYADPYNPVDAIFAAARYLHAAGASHNLRRAILAYNHSQAYVEAVMLRARLIASYPRAVIGTLAGLVDGQAPTRGAHLAPGAGSAPASAPLGAIGETGQSTAGSASTAPTPASATAGAVPASPLTVGASALHASGTATPAAAHTAKAAHRAAAVPGTTPPPPPQVLAARAEAAANAPAKPAQLVDLLGTPGAPVVAVQSGRVVHLGHSHALGTYLVLRDVYGDIFTYAGLGEIAPRYRRPVPPADLAQHTPGSVATTGPGSTATAAPGATARGASGAASAATGASDPAPTLPASAGHQSPVTLKVKSRTAHIAATPVPVESEAESAPAGLGKVRLYAHPDNPLARAVAARAKRAAGASNGRWLPLRSGALVSQGTVLGHLSSAPGSAPGAAAGTLRFAVRPAGDGATVDPSALLTNWRLLGAALHPRGSKGRVELLGATADEVFAMSKSELQRSVLADPGVQLDACGRRDVAEGAIDRRVLGVLEFLSRSGLQPTVGALQCARGKTTAAGPVFEHFAGGALDITAINEIPIAGHQGPGTVTDATIRALLALPKQFVPHRILSLMEYPHADNTFARAGDWNRIRIGFGPIAASAHAASAHAASGGAGQIASSLAASGSLNAGQWNQLVDRIAALPQPTVSTKPSSSAIRDPQAAPSNRALGAR